MARAPEDYEVAIKEFEQAARLAPNASDVETVKSVIDKLESKAEPVLSVPEGFVGIP